MCLMLNCGCYRSFGSWNFSSQLVEGVEGLYFPGDNGVPMNIWPFFGIIPYFKHITPINIPNILPIIIALAPRETNPILIIIRVNAIEVRVNAIEVRVNAIEVRVNAIEVRVNAIEDEIPGSERKLIVYVTRKIGLRTKNKRNKRWSFSFLYYAGYG
jgi:hypothetical protein